MLARDKAQVVVLARSLVFTLHVTIHRVTCALRQACALAPTDCGYLRSDLPSLTSTGKQQPLRLENSDGITAQNTRIHPHQDPAFETPTTQASGLQHLATRSPGPWRNKAN